MSVASAERLCEMLKAKAIQPVLVDIGAAVAPPRVWGRSRPPRSTSGSIRAGANSTRTRARGSCAR